MGGAKPNNSSDKSLVTKFYEKGVKCLPKTNKPTEEISVNSANSHGSQDS